MKYSLNINREGTNKFYTQFLLERLIKVNRHKITSNIEADFILVSICDITELKLLKEIRETYQRKKIIVGGHVAVFFKALLIFADYVNVGQGFEFFKCQSEEEIKQLDCIYYNGKNKIIKPSNFIEWGKCPVVQSSKKGYLYLSGIGCKNKCQFCLTSWTNKQNNNSLIRINKAFNLIEKKKARLKLIENEGLKTSDKKEFVKDMLLVDFVKANNINAIEIRIGVEFAKEETRKITGKYFSNKQFLQAIQRAKEDNIKLKCFCISGMDTKQDWINLISQIPNHYKLSPRLVFKFTNLEYQMFTPLHKKRFDINLDNYLTYEFGIELFKKFGAIQKNFKTLPIKYPAYALYRMALSHCTNKEEFNQVWEYRNCKDLNKIHSMLYKKIIYNEYNNEIKFWYQK